MGRKKSQTVGYKYFVGVHFVLCHGPIDRISHIYVDDKLLWVPVNDTGGTGVEGGYERVGLHAPELFGGEDREGGISGEIDIGMGYRSQGKNDYLQGRLAGKLIPGYRGVVSVILRRMYVGTNPYLKPWKFRVQRIWAPTATGDAQWEPAIAGIGEPGDTVAYAAQTLLQTPMAGFSFVVGAKHYQLTAGADWRPRTGPGDSDISLVVSDFETGERWPEAVYSPSWGMPVAKKLPLKAPYDRYRLIPLTKDYKILPNGKVLFPLCLSYTGYETSPPYQFHYIFEYHYAGIFDLETHEITHIRYPASPLMNQQRNVLQNVVKKSFNHLQLLGGNAVGRWDELGEKYIVMGSDGGTYELDPLAGTVMPHAQSSPLLNDNDYVLATCPVNHYLQFTLLYAFHSVNGVRMDKYYGVVHDIRTGMKVWESKKADIIPDGALGYPGYLNEDICAFSMQDGYIYVSLPWRARRYMTIDYQFLVYFISGPMTGTPVHHSNLGLPPPKNYNVGSVAQAVAKPIFGRDGRAYFFPTCTSTPGFIFSRGDWNRGVMGRAKLMPWTLYAPNTNPSHDIQFVYPFSWHGAAMAFAAVQDLPVSDPGPAGWRGAYLVSPGSGKTKAMPGKVADMNPVHIIRECMTNTEWGRGLPDSIIGPSYTTAAETLYLEGLGLSMLWTSELAVNDFILEVIRHIDAVRYEDPETGLQEIKLIRPDYVVDELPVLTPSNCQLDQLTEPTQYDLVNQITVEFWNRDTGEDSAVAVQDTAAVNMAGTINNQTMQYSGVCSTRVAMMIAQRDLARYSKPFRSGRLLVNRRVANLKPGDPFILSWPARGVTQMVCRVAKRSDNGELDGMTGIEFGEDIFSAGYNVAAVPPPSGWEDPVKPPVNFDYATMFDVPYPVLVDELGEAAAEALPDDAGFAGFAGARPLTGTHTNYGLHLYARGTTPPTDTMTELATPFTALAILAEDIPEITTEDIFIDVGPVTDLSAVRAGDWILVGGAADKDREVMCVTADPQPAGVTLAVRRAVADSYPRAVVAGTPLYIIGSFFGTDDVERLNGEWVAGYGRPKNGSGSYQGPFTYLETQIVARQGRPYPAAALKVDGAMTPDLSTPRSRIVLSWAHRHRVQQGNQALSWVSDQSVGPEPGVTYQVWQEALDSQHNVITVIPPISAGADRQLVLNLLDQPYPAGSVFARVKVVAVRGGVESLQNRPATVRLAPRLYAPTALLVSYVGPMAVKAPSGLRASYDPGTPPLYAPTGISAAYVGQDKLVAASGLAARYIGPAKLAEPASLIARYVGPAKLAEPASLIARYVGPAKLAEPASLIARYVGPATLQAASGLSAVYVGPAKLAAPVEVTAVYVGPAKLVAPIGLSADYTGPAKLVAASALSAFYVGQAKLVEASALSAVYVGQAKLVEASALSAVYVGPAKMQAPSAVTASYHGLPALARPGDLVAQYDSGVERLQAPSGLAADYI